MHTDCCLLERGAPAIVLAGPCPTERYLVVHPVDNWLAFYNTEIFVPGTHSGHSTHTRSALHPRPAEVSGCQCQNHTSCRMTNTGSPLFERLLERC